jgi:cytochrome c oxidase subunit II
MDTRLVRAGSLAFLILFSSANTGARAFQASGSSQDRTIVKISAERFTFTPSKVAVKLGTVVEFRLRSDDTNHGFKIVGSTANVIIPKRGRGEATLIFRADTAGRYTFECSKMCGAGHSFMRGELTVEE